MRGKRHGARRWHREPRLAGPSLQAQVSHLPSGPWQAEILEEPDRCWLVIEAPDGWRLETAITPKSTIDIVVCPGIYLQIDGLILGLDSDYDPALEDCWRRFFFTGDEQWYIAAEDETRIDKAISAAVRWWDANRPPPAS